MLLGVGVGLSGIFTFLDAYVALVFYLGFFVFFGVEGYWGEGWGYFLGGFEVVLVGLLVELFDAFLHGYEVVFNYVGNIISTY